MKLNKWFAMRGLQYVVKRGADLTRRYGLGPSLAEARIQNCLDTLAKYNCAPTLPTPGRIVKRYSPFIRQLQDRGAEIAVHSFDHVDLRTYPLTDAKQQLLQAVQAFKQNGIEIHGFRCPYLGCSNDLLDSLPDGLFGYSSNRAIQWEVPSTPGSTGLVFDTINRFYQPQSAQHVVCVPCTRSNLIEIPVCVPDDLQLHDGLNLGSAGISRFWYQVLERTHQRGELFTLLFHPELASSLGQSFEELLLRARRLEPGVWLARLRDISDWWREKSKFGVRMSPIPTGLRLDFTCTPRATILARGLNSMESTPVWDGAYHRLRSNTLEIPSIPHPFVGLAPNTPERIVSFLLEQGYILDTSETARSCGIYLDDDLLGQLTSEVDLVDYIESSTAALVRFGRWPYGLKSTLCITGDLDALALKDYGYRFFKR